MCTLWSGCCHLRQFRGVAAERRQPLALQHADAGAGVATIKPRDA
jgi:hypothetical protein